MNIATAESPTESQKWVLHSGCHRGTLMSRDSGCEEHATLEDCKKAVAEAEKFYRSIGYYVWYAYAIGPNGEKETLHPGTSYRR